MWAHIPFTTASESEGPYWVQISQELPHGPKLPWPTSRFRDPSSASMRERVLEGVVVDLVDDAVRLGLLTDDQVCDVDPRDGVGCEEDVDCIAIDNHTTDRRTRCPGASL